VSFCAEVCVILGRMRDAREEALEEAVPDGECSLKIVVPAAMQELSGRKGG